MIALNQWMRIRSNKGIVVSTEPIICIALDSIIDAVFPSALKPMWRT